MRNILSFRRVRNLTAMFVAVAAVGIMSQGASAQSCGYGGGGGYGGGYGSFYGGGYGGGFYGGNYHPGISVGVYRSSYRVPRHTWHDTSHWDHSPGRYVPHGNHVDYVPGHSTWHRDGHVDHNHR